MISKFILKILVWVVILTTGVSAQEAQGVAFKAHTDASAPDFIAACSKNIGDLQKIGAVGTRALDVENQPDFLISSFRTAANDFRFDVAITNEQNLPVAKLEKIMQQIVSAKTLWMVVRAPTAKEASRIPTAVGMYDLYGSSGNRSCVNLTEGFSGSITAKMRDDYLSDAMAAPLKGASEPTLATIDPTAGELLLEETPEALKAFTNAVMFGVHRLNFNDRWRDDLKKFSLDDAEKLARAIMGTSMKERYEVRGARYVLFYNSSADLYALLKAEKGKDVSVGFVPGQYFSEELYKFKERANYIDNMLKNRPVVFRQLVKDFPRSDVFDSVFSRYRTDEDLSHLVKVNLIAFLELARMSIETGCRQAITAALNETEISFVDGRKASQLRPFYLSTSFLIAEDADKPLRVAAAFHDKRTNRHGGYAVFVPGGADKCKITTIITTVY